MPNKIIDGYDLEFTAEQLEGCELWGAYVAILAPSDNPMHMNTLHPRQRVAADQSLPDQAAAEAAAERAGVDILAGLRTNGH